MDWHRDLIWFVIGVNNLSFWDVICDFICDLAMWFDCECDLICDLPISAKNYSSQRCSPRDCDLGLKIAQDWNFAVLVLEDRSRLFSRPINNLFAHVHLQPWGHFHESPHGTHESECTSRFGELYNSIVMVVLQRSWNFNSYCEQCVFVLFAGFGLLESWSRSCSCSWHCWSLLQDVTG